MSNKMLYQNKKNVLLYPANNPPHLKTRSSWLHRGLLVLIASLSLLANANHKRTGHSSDSVLGFKAVSKKVIAPTNTFFDEGSQPVNIKSFQGKFVLLNVWATWCGPCLRELPALDRLQAKFDKSEFVIVPVSIDKQDISATSPYYRKMGLKNLAFYHDIKQQMGKFFPLDVVPANFILDRNGKPVSYLRGFVDWDDKLASEMIQYYVQHESDTPPAWSPPH